MEPKAGDILHAYCAFIPDYKYVICICPINRYFFLINSEPRRRTPDAQIRITKEDFPFLRHDSYINTANFCTIYPTEIRKATFKGKLPTHIKAEIIKVVNNGGHLSPRHKTLVQINLSS